MLPFQTTSLHAQEETVVTTQEVQDTVTTGGETGTVGEGTTNTESTTPTTEAVDTTNDTSEDTTATTIDTGDADALLESETDANTNNTSVTEVVTTQQEESETSTDTSSEETDKNTEDTTSTGDVPPDSETTVTNDNTADVALDATITADTGNNTALDNNEAIITTGNAVSTANVVNVVNTNIFNSTGLFYFLNLILGNISFDTRDLFSIFTGDTEVTGGCGDADPCTVGDTSVTVNNTNTAVVNNTLELIANTGSNTGSATGDVSITTGDAYASANIVNLVNTNITDTNYLLLTINGFDAGSGGVVFPGAEWFYELLSQGESIAQGSQVTVENTNTAIINNTSSVTADSGGNTVEGDDTSITTGNSGAQTSIVNQVNTNIFGSSISLLFNIQGSWAGEIFGLPDGMSWRETASGVEIFFDGDTVQAPAGSTDNLTVTNTNNAEISNNVSVFALTGDNMATSESGDANIETGSAQASANIVNIVNTNVLGRNWILAIFNILGDWNGNISFGQPDLWIGVRALTQPANIRVGSCFEYEFTVNNFGDADAHDVVLYSNHTPFQQAIDFMQREANGSYSYPIGDVASGDSITFTLPICVSEFANANRDITTTFEVLENEDDADYANNKDTIGFTMAKAIGSALVFGKKYPDFSIQKVVDKKTITASSTVTYEITIQNGENPIYNALLVDTIFNPDNRPIHEQRWGLGTILKNETIIISYEALFNEDSSAGMYLNEAFISGTTREPAETVQDPIKSPVASVSVNVVDELPAAPSTTCTPLLNTYIQKNGNNSRDEVGELQFFLRTIEGDTSVSLTKEYDEATIQAVRAFQERYAQDILEPWGMTESSGYVYYTTQKKINELWCKDIDFSLTDEQLKEIETFKKRTRNYIERHVNLPEETFEMFGSMQEEAPVPVPAIHIEKEEQTTEQQLVYPHQIATAEAATEGVDTMAALINALRTGVKNSLLFFSR